MEKPKSRKFIKYRLQKNLDLCTNGHRVQINSKQKQELIDLGADPERVEKFETMSDYRLCRKSLLIQKQLKSSR